MAKSEAENEALKRDVARRLKAVMEDNRLETVDELSDYMAATRSATSNWLQAYYLVPMANAIELKRRTGVTLDWLYDGDARAMSPGANIRLTAILEGLTPPHIHPEPPARRSLEKESAGIQACTAGVSARVGVGASVPAKGKPGTKAKAVALTPGTRGNRRPGT